MTTAYCMKQQNEKQSTVSNRILQLHRSKLGTACGNTVTVFITMQSYHSIVREPVFKQTAWGWGKIYE